MKYYEFIGKEPSILELYDFTENNKALYASVDTNVISSYIDFSNKYGGYYYIGGNIKTFPKERILYQNIEKAKKLNENAQITHQMEYFSQIRSRNELINLEKILDIYYEEKMAEYYAPPYNGNDAGEGYIHVAETTKIGKKDTE